MFSIIEYEIYEIYPITDGEIWSNFFLTTSDSGTWAISRDTRLQYYPEWARPLHDNRSSNYGHNTT